MEKLGLDAILVTDRSNYFYLSNFTGSFGYLLFTKDKKFLITDSRYTIQASQQARDFEIIKYEEPETIYNILKKYKKTGFETSLSYAKYSKFSEFSTLVPLGDIISSLRLKKTPEEAEKIYEAVKLADDAFSYIINYIKKGKTELEIAFELEKYMRERGSKPSFDIIAASGENSALPHASPQARKVKNGDSLILDFGCIFNHYCSDMTRTIFIGTPSKKHLDMYNTVLKAQEKAINLVGDRVKCSEINAAAKNYIKDCGYGEFFEHALGHGIGIEVHERPRVSPLSEEIIENGMIFSIEPGIYIKGIGGIRIEDLVYVKDGKCEVMTKSTKKVIII